MKFQLGLVLVASVCVLAWFEVLVALKPSTTIPPHRAVTRSELLAQCCSQARRFLRPSFFAELDGALHPKCLVFERAYCADPEQTNCGHARLGVRAESLVLKEKGICNWQKMRVEICPSPQAEWCLDEYRWGEKSTTLPLRSLRGLFLTKPCVSYLNTKCKLPSISFFFALSPNRSPQTSHYYQGIQ